ncbi:MAG: alanine--tRNA ligase [Candidatus Omnitrophota bacterium]
MTHDQIRKKFLAFFEGKKHTVVSSDNLVPAGDPTVLFTSAGMNQFKEQFLGNIKGFTRACSCQKCLRTDDLVNVGVTTYHHTFFEMLGNFSFGDYFKKEAIQWAWEFLRQEINIPEDKLRVSVYEDDEEAYLIWKNDMKLPEQKIARLDDKQNFWPSQAKKNGPNGPCGPCSEIFYDYGKEKGCDKNDCGPGCDCGRFVEVWNLVFTQFNRRDAGILEPLPKKNIDTGMGLERLCAVVQGVNTNFDTDLFTPIIEAIKNETAKAVDRPINFDKHKKDIYAIADHIRAVCFAICDGIVPSNEKHGYVIRSLIRKSAMHARAQGVMQPFLYKIVPSVANTMQLAYPELKKRRENVSQIVLAEEERFIVTLREGMRELEEEYNRRKAEAAKQISGEFAFKLFDTHGLPFDVTQAASAERGFTVDKKEFDRLMEGQREQSRKKSQIHDAIFKEPLVKEKVEFIGYEKLNANARVLNIFKDSKQIDEINLKETADVVLDKSPFYGESGGQVGDTGVLSSENFIAKVLDAKKDSDAILLKVLVEKGSLKKNDMVNAQVDAGRRMQIVKNHTATHLLQSALRKVLGEHVQQQGSMVAAEKLRFDFTHFNALTQDELDRVEQLVNEKIHNADLVNCYAMDIDKAKQKGALAFFKDKYEKQVRVVCAGDYSMELCGGTHVGNTKEIEMFKIISEGSVASGIRRIEAVTGRQAIEIINQQQAALRDICAALGCTQGEAPERISRLQADVDNLQKRLKQVILDRIRLSMEKLINESEKVNKAFFIYSVIKDADSELLRSAVDVVKMKLKDDDWIAFFGCERQKQASLILSISPNMINRGLHSGKIISRIAAAAGGSGGGRPDMAQAGIKGISDIDNVLDKGKAIILEELRK